MGKFLSITIAVSLVAWVIGFYELELGFYVHSLLVLLIVAIFLSIIRYIREF